MRASRSYANSGLNLLYPRPSGEPGAPKVSERGYVSQWALQPPAGL